MKDRISNYIEKLKNGFERIAANVRQRPHLVILAIILYFVLVDTWSFEGVFFWTLFLIFLFLKIDNRILVFFGLFFLFISPFYLIFYQEAERVQKFADYAYYFLLMSVLLELIFYAQQKLDSFWMKTKNKYVKNGH